MDLQPFPNQGDVSPEEFHLLFRARLGDALFDRIMVIFSTWDRMHSHSIANCVHLGLQKGNADEVVRMLEEWHEVYTKAPHLIEMQVDTRKYFELMYEELFIQAGDSIRGTHLVPGTPINGHRTYTLAPERPKLWTPG